MSEIPSELPYYLGFSLIPGIGPVRLERLVAHFGSAADAWRGSPIELARAGLDDRSAQALVERRPRLDLDAELARCERLGVSLVVSGGPAYPKRLAETYGAPFLLYVRGEFLPTDDLAIAVVGTRRATPYGRQATERIAADLAAAGVTIVSGLARGIDTCAHRAALGVSGRTIAVLGCGVDVAYPPENARLAAEIAERGALVSEYPLGAKPDAQNFPARNRIISGLARGTLVIEAGDKSGALLTAKFAADQNRDVFAVPGNIFAPTSAGANRLIRDGAKLVASANDVLEELDVATIEQQLEIRELLPLDGNEAKLVGLLSAEPMHFDELCRESGLSASEVGSTLTLLELKGHARNAGGASYVIGR